MPSQFNGDAANITPPTALNISSSTDSTPIGIITSSAHGLSDGDTVDVRDHQVNLNANGIWTILTDPLNPAHLLLVGSTATGGGNGANTGTVQPITFGSTYQIPSDGDDEDAASVDTAFEGIGDRSAFLLVGTGVFKLANVARFGADVGTTIPPTSWTGGTLASSGAWLASGTTFSVADIVAGDFIEIELDTTLFNGGGSGAVRAGVKLATSQSHPGGSGSYTLLSNSAKFNYSPSGAVVYSPVHCRGFLTATITGTLGIQPYLLTDVMSTDVELIGDYTIVAKVWRPTRVPQ